MTEPANRALGSREPVAPTPDPFDALARADAFPEELAPEAQVTHVQTHLSHVYLTETRVYKFRKPTNLGFVDFTTLAERNADCLREIALNRRLAPDVYLGVAPLLRGEPPRVGPIGEKPADAGLEHCVVMRRLEDGRDALSLLRADRLSRPDIDRIAACIAAFHEQVGLGRPAPFSPAEWRDACTGPFRDCLDVILRIDGEEDLRARGRRLNDRLLALREELDPVFESRRAAGAAVDGHGDLHLQHIWFEDDPVDPIVIDCLEFSSELRRIDAACDIAFTAMDLRYRERPDLAERLLRRYAGTRFDTDLYRVVDYFSAYRAAVRAKVAAIAAQAGEIEPAQRNAAAASARRHLDLCETLLRPAAPGALVLVGGVVGTGKSVVAEALAAEIERQVGSVVIGSDVLRKRLAGVAPDAHLRGAVDRDAYAPEARARVYAALLERAEAVVVSGRVALLDATWERREARQQAFALARRLGAPGFMVQATCAPELATRRLAQRRRGGDPSGSDAGPELHPVSLARFEAWRGDETGTHRWVHTDRPEWRSRLGALASEIACARPPLA